MKYKNYIIISSLLLLVIAGIISTSFLEQQQLESESMGLKPSANSKAIFDNKKSLEQLEYWNEQIALDKNPNILNEILKILERQVSCIRSGSCLQKGDQTLFTEKLDVAYIVMRKALELVNSIVNMDDDKMKLVKDNLLVEVVNLEHPSSMFLALNILMRKGRASFNKILPYVKKYRGDAALTFSRTFKNSFIFDTNEQLKVKNDILYHYLTEDILTANLLLQHSRYLTVDKITLEKIFLVACPNANSLETETIRGEYKSNLSELMKKNGLTQRCQ